jgi:c(7)-type cytochrome triheme protein
MATGFRFLLRARSRLVFPALCAVAVVLYVQGCTSTKEVKELGKDPGLDTIPVYQKGSLAFNTKDALRKIEEDKESEKLQFESEVKKRVEGKTSEYKFTVFDPWVPPAVAKDSQFALALRYFPKDKYGYPDWQEAVRRGVIKPRSTIKAKEQNISDIEESQFEADIIFEINDRLMANVRFPHKAHTYWLSCKVCHPGIFIAKKGANAFTMYNIWEGEYCGRCHGKIAFPPKGFENCRKCHSSKKKTMGIR